MIRQKCKFKIVSFSVLFFAFTLVQLSVNAHAKSSPRPIVIKQLNESIFKRMEREITLDVRDMNIVDVIKFLALKGEFNVVISPTVEGRVTVLLNNVNIKDSLDIVIIANRLAYKVENNIVQIFSSAEYESIYGKRFSDKTQVEIIHLKYSKPSYVLAALDNIKSNVGKIIIDEDTGSVVMIDTAEAIKLMKEALVEIEKPLETITYALQYAKADVVAEKLRARIDAKAVGSITPDERSNKLIVRAYPERTKEVLAILKKLDVATKEVMVDARILQIVLKPEYDVGVDWQVDFGKSSDAPRFSNLYMDADNISASDNLSSTFASVAVGDISTDQFEAKIRSLEQVSDTKILSNPKILVTNNEEAKIHIGDTVPYIISTTSGTGDNAITSEDVRF
ncbi:MAG: type II secretory pathway component GspD/PulD (secretin), partial [Lysobacterales bacterium]